MNIDAQIFLTSLKHQGYSKSSLKNYKTDVLQFLTWRTNENLDKETFRSAFSIYKKVIKANYKTSSYKRKVAAVSKFINHVEPKPLSPVNQPLPKFYQRNAILLGGYSLALVAILGIVPLLTRQNVEYTSVPNVKLIETDYDEINAKGVTVAISAPSNLDDTGDNMAIVLPSDVAVYEDANKQTGSSLIKAGKFSTTIYSVQHLTNSFIYLTPTSPTDGNILFIEGKGDGWFKVSIENTTNKDISFDWAIINAENSSKLL